MACQLCQANITYNVLAWTEYAQNCVNKTILSYPRPVPSGTAIPAWAYQNVTKSNRFNGSEALDVSQQGLPDTTGTNLPPIPTASATVSVPSSRKSSDVGVIVGGAVGGVLGLALFGVLLYHALRREDYERVAQGQATEEPPMSAAIRRAHTRRDTGETDRSMSLLSTYTMPIYNPDDPSTFPPPPTPPPSFFSRASSPAAVGAPLVGHMRTFSVSEKRASPTIGTADLATRASIGTHTPPPPFASRAPSPAVCVPIDGRTRASSVKEKRSGSGIAVADSKARAGTY
ncbi:hypothetical protein L226DRAFT_77477 [Lentinus tigrinus ALCF2SS1-7]|uniref:uncharacterized protein n=1 Tax=Lentinus tigrinus ALCF2SS1-7 TaxID=1328758 RepID=UPI001165E991|nr:hypothetical protein L226DRAFT_77477 [Lentinus tigrinus ALCF2SS1-7]